jgi:WD40 repeat protein
MKRMHLLSLAVVVALLPVLATADPPKDSKDAKTDKQVSYYKDVRPIFAQHCQGCHQPAMPKGDYVMTDYAGLIKKGESDKLPIVPNKPDESNLLKMLHPREDGKAQMPKGKDPLPDFQIKLITNWIAQGASDDTPMSAKAPAVNQDNPPVYELPPIVTALAFSPDSQLLAVSGYHEVLLHKADGSEQVGRLVGLSERIQSLAFSPDGKTLAVCGGDPGRFGEIQLWDVDKQRLKSSILVTFDTVYGVSWSPDGMRVAVGCADNTLRAFDAATGEQVLFQGAHGDWTLGTAWSLDGTFLVSVSRDRTVKLTEVATQRFIDNVTSITPGALKGGLAAIDVRPMSNKKTIKRKEDSGGGELLYNEVLVGGADGQPRLYKMHRETKRVIGDDANRIREFEKFPGRIYAVAFNKEGNLFVAGSSLDGVGEARVFEVDSGKRLSTFEGVKTPVYSLAFRPDGKAVATAGFDGSVRLNDPTSGKLIKEFVPVPMGKK